MSPPPQGVYSPAPSMALFAPHVWVVSVFLYVLFPLSYCDTALQLHGGGKGPWDHCVQVLGKSSSPLTIALSCHLVILVLHSLTSASILPAAHLPSCPLGGLLSLPPGLSLSSTVCASCHWVWYWHIECGIDTLGLPSSPRSCRIFCMNRLVTSDSNSSAFQLCWYSKPLSWPSFSFFIVSRFLINLPSLIPFLLYKPWMPSLHPLWCVQNQPLSWVWLCPSGCGW